MLAHPERRKPRISACRGPGGEPEGPGNAPGRRRRVSNGPPFPGAWPRVVSGRTLRPRDARRSRSRAPRPGRPSPACRGTLARRARAIRPGGRRPSAHHLAPRNPSPVGTPRRNIRSRSHDQTWWISRVLSSRAGGLSLEPNSGKLANLLIPVPLACWHLTTGLRDVREHDSPSGGGSSLESYILNLFYGKSLDSPVRAHHAPGLCREFEKHRRTLICHLHSSDDR